MIPRIVVGLIVFVSILLCKSPLSLGIFVLIARPLIQPYAVQGLKLAPGVPLTGSFAVAFIILTVSICLMKKNYSLYFAKIIPIYLLLFFSITSFYNSLNLTMSIAFVLKFATGISMCILIYNAIETKSDANKILFGIVIASIIPMIFGYYQFITQTARVEGTRVDSLFGFANSYGEFLAITFCGTLMLLLQKQTRFIRIFLIFVVCSLIVSMLISKNRGQWISLSTGLLFGLLGYIRKIKLKWFVIGAALIAIFFSGLIINRFEQLNERKAWGTRTNTFANRIANWNSCLRLVPLHPISGHGIGTASIVSMEHYGDIRVPHNDFVRLMLEAGIPSMLCYMTFLSIILLSNILRIFDKTNWFINYPMLVLIIYWLTHSVTQNMIYNVTVFTMFMALFALSTKYNLISSKEVPKG